ncbi:MAG: hypothetical protein DWQ07_16630 [Chloroflexi bacterium]|nr:MAG: hypothetical protein DWQ07_16630 [Chloroflexota bacterium]MBL1195378.1 hypothetical protein [Chloroflexota bacterium]NOH12661.1 hypothetical protein [Chloroflexota bacterium]
MFAKKRTVIILMLLPLLVLAACDGGFGGGGECNLADFVAPSNTSPAAGDIILEYEPMFVWAYSGDCEPPGGWQAEVTTYGGYDFGVTQTNTSSPAVVFTVFDMPLEPATQYEWRAAARTEAGELGPYSMSTSFWTGPICETAALNAPMQFTPDDGGIVDNEFPPMGWNYPDGCIPELTLLQLDTDPAFPGPNLVGGLGGPRIGQIPLAALDDCTQYHWRVRSENPDGVGPWSPVRSFYTDFLGGCPTPVLATCDTADLIAPANDFPTAGDVGVELEPLFDWHYPDDCTPEGYRIDVTTFGGYDFGETYSGGTGNPSTEWFVGEPLEPATQYEWRAAGINGTTLGPYSTSTSFWTGPICETASLMAPVQNGPANGSRVDNPFPPLSWSYPGECIPELTLLELDVDPAFPGPNLIAAGGLGAPRIGQIPADALLDCTEYHWRVRSENPDGAGPYSPTWSFITDFTGACSVGPAPSSAPMASAPQNLNCREGDSTAYEVTGFFLQGESAEIVGRNQQGDWIVIPKKTNGGNCWVSTGLVNLDPLVNLNELSVIIPPPLPEPTPTPTQLPVANPFAVTSVSVSVDDDNFAGSCPHRFTFAATIEVNGPGTVEYKWLRNDGATAPPQTLVFTSAGSQQVTSTWDLGASGQRYDDFWKQIEIIAPNSVLSNQAYFSLACK